MNPVFTTLAGKSVVLGKQLGVGGEGQVWTVQGQLEVAKIYHARNVLPEHEGKLKAMVANPPVDEMRLKGHVSIAWPTDLLYQGGKFSGFLMPMIEQSPTIFAMYNPQRRKKDYPGFNWKYLLHTAFNLSKAIEAIHSKNYVIGDLNESNILVTSSALVSVIDTDSFQVRGSNGQIYRCKVGKEDFTPPELFGAPLDRVDRLPEHDYFGLGVLIFRLLMEGYYPFTGVLRQNIPLTEPVQYYCLKQGAFPYISNSIVDPPLMAPPFNMLPRDVRNLFMRCFVAGNKNLQARPSPREWGHVLERAEKQLVACKANPGHYYAGHLAQCPWCQREQSQPKQAPPPLQTPLPPVRRSRPSTPARLPAARSPFVGRPVIPALLASLAAQPKPAAQPLSAVQPAPANPVPAPSLAGQSGRFVTARRLARSIRSGVRRFLHSPGGYLDRRVWWRGTWKFMLWGVAGGAGLFALIFLVYWFPILVGYIAGALTGGLIGASVLLGARWVDRQPFKRARVVAGGILLAGGALAVFLGLHVSRLVGTSLSAWWPHLGALALDCFLTGLLGGTAYGNFQTLSRRRSLALALVTSLLLALIPFGIIALLTLIGLPLPV